MVPAETSNAIERVAVPRERVPSDEPDREIRRRGEVHADPSPTSRVEVGEACNIL